VEVRPFNCDSDRLSSDVSLVDQPSCNSDIADLFDQTTRFERPLVAAMTLQACCHLIWRALACQCSCLRVVAGIKLLVMTPSAAGAFIDFAIDLY
jgi:hypothetical protein